MALFDIRDVDRAFWREKLEDFVPSRVLDVHTHVWKDEFRSSLTQERAVTWPMLVARENPIEDLLETYRLLLPGREVTPLIFSLLGQGDDFTAGNGYIEECARRYSLPSLLFAHSSWSATELEQKIKAGGHQGIKVYLTLSEPYLPVREIRIFDFLPPHQLEVLQQHGWLVMLHIPRDERLRDPVNLAQMIAIERRYPRVKVVIAHVGRAYCEEDIGNAFEVLAETQHMAFDISANTNATVFTRLLQAVGPRRVLFGSDLPIVRMRMQRICENGRYINLVPRGLYGDVTGDPNMREVDGPAADSISLFLYEELDALRRAVETLGLDRDAVSAIFYGNAARWLNLPEV